VRSTVRIRPQLAVAVAVAGLVGIGWVARTTLAQKSPPPPAETLPAPVSLPGQEKADPFSAQPPPTAPVVSAGSTVELQTASGLPSAGESEDPEKNVQAFVEQNRKVAESQLKNLKDEAEKLRARLQKVEAGIRRWEALLTALQTSEAGPADLEPIPQARHGFNTRAVPAPSSSRPQASPPRREPVPDSGSGKPSTPQDLEPAPPAAPR